MKPTFTYSRLTTNIYDRFWEKARPFLDILRGPDRELSAMKDQDPNQLDRLPEDEDAMVRTGKGEIVLYQTEDGQTRVECRFQDETIWLSQAVMAELYQKDVRTINEHLKDIYSDKELAPEATIRKFRIVRREGRREVAREIEHYNLDAILAVGDGAAAGVSRQGLCPGRPAAEESAGAGGAGLFRRDARTHPRCPGRRKQVFMQDWEQRLNEFLQFNARDVLTNAGSIGKANADAFAEEQYDRFAERRRTIKEAQGEQDTFKALEDAARNRNSGDILKSRPRGGCCPRKFL